MLAGPLGRLLVDDPHPPELDGLVVVLLRPQVPEELREEPKEEDELRDELNEDERPLEKPPLLPPPLAKLSAGHRMASERRDAVTTRDMERKEGNMTIIYSSKM